MAENDPLEELLLDAQEIDRTTLTRALKEYIGIDSNSGTVVLRPSWNRLNARAKVLAYLLGQKTAYLLKKSADDGSPPKQIVVATGMPQGTVAPKLKELLEDRVITKSSDGTYRVADHQIWPATQEMEGSEVSK